MNWISVEDRLPDHDNTVLIYSPHLIHSIKMGYYYRSKWFALSGGREDITHWAELTKPKQKQE